MFDATHTSGSFSLGDEEMFSNKIKVVYTFFSLWLNDCFIEEGTLVLASFPNNNPRLEISLRVHLYMIDIQELFYQR
jgi:hypothetical protein